MKGSIFVTLTLTVLIVSQVYASEVKSKTSNWVVYKEGQEFMGTSPPERPPKMTGFFSTAVSNQLDYKQEQDKFENQIMQFPVVGYTETFYESNSTIPISYASDSLDTRQTVNNKQIDTGISAYDKYVIKNNLSFDISNGQWLLNNKYFSRFNDLVRTNKDNGNMYISDLNKTPWGVESSLTNASRDEFLVALAKISYGSIESRPILFEVPAYRPAIGVRWIKIFDEFGNVIGFRYHEETYGEALESIQRNGDNILDRPATNDYTYQRVSDIRGYETSSYIYRGEYVSKPENTDYKIFHTYTSDYWSYVNTNVWELYIIKLLSMGILDYNELFNMADIKAGVIQSSVNIGQDGDTFEFNSQASKGIKEDYLKYGKTIEDGKTYYPAYAPELGIVIANSSNQNHSLRNIDYIDISGTKVLGSNYDVYGNEIVFLSDNINNASNQNQSGLPANRYSVNQSLTNISALRLIERVLRVEERNMSTLEASIISQKYGAKYLDNIPEVDRKTVEYLIALGIIDFENYSEYSNLYNVLSREFCYTLLYRVANPNARTDFSKVLLTDASSLSLSDNISYSNYQNSILTNDSTTLSKYISNDGRLIYDGLNNESKELSFVSSLYVDNVYPSSNSNPIYHVVLNIDDPIKYLYRNLPLTVTTHMYNMNNIVKDDTLIKDNNEVKMLPVYINPWGQKYDSNKEYFLIYPENNVGSKDARAMREIELFNNNQGIDDFLNGYSPFQINDLRWLDNTDPTGIVSINKINNSERYLIDISISAVDEKSAITFVKANLVNRTRGLLEEQKINTIVSKSKNLLLDSNNKFISDNVKIDNNIINGDTYVNNKIGLNSSTLISEDISTELDKNIMISNNVLKQSLTHLTNDSIGDKPTIALQSELLDKPNTIIYDTMNKISNNVLVRKFKLPEYINQGDKNYYDITTYGNGSTLIKDRMFKYKNKSGVEEEINGTIVVEFTLELPNKEEQHSMIGGNIQTSKMNLTDLRSWIYTEPKIPQLLKYWEYNKYINNAILETIGSSEISIDSGYLYPSLTILLDKVPKGSGELGLSNEEFNSISREFLKEVGSHINKDWIDKYIGSSYIYNLTTNEIDSLELEKLKGQGLLSGALNNLTLENPPPNGILKTSIDNNLPIWAEIYFNNATPSNVLKTNIIHSRLGLPKYNIYSIFDFIGNNKIYGKKDREVDLRARAVSTTDVGDISYSLPFIKSDFDYLFMDLDNSNYTYNEELNILEDNRLSSVPNISTGLYVKYKEIDWYVSSVDESEIHLVMINGLQSIIKNSKAIDILESSKMYIDGIFGLPIDESADEKQTYNFNIFDTSIPVSNVSNVSNVSTFNKKFIEIKDNVIQAYKYVDENGILVKKKTLVSDGESVLFRPFVTLSRSAWDINSDNNIIWSKKFLGANYNYYSPQNNLLLMKSDILPIDSLNRVKYKDLKQSDLTIGNIKVNKLEDNSIMLKIPFSNSLIDNSGNINKSEIDKLGTIVQAPDNKFFLNTDYLNNIKIASYNKTYLDYDNTLIRYNNNLYIANKGSLEKYTQASLVNDVAIISKIDDNISFIFNSEDNGNKTRVLMDTRQDIIPLNLNNLETPILAISNLPIGIDFSGERVDYHGVNNAVDYFNSLIDYANTMRNKNLIGKLIWMIIFICSSGSIFIVLARAMKIVVIIQSVFYEIWETSGIDIFRIISFGLINVEDEPMSWFQTLIYSFIFCLVPLLILSVLNSIGIQYI